MVKQFPLESLLSARQLVSAKLYGDTIYFISNMSGRFSLYKMHKSGSIPIPLLPEGISLQNPQLMNGENFEVFPELGKIVVMIDENGNELYQPNVIPINGGVPKPMLNDTQGMQVNLWYADASSHLLVLGIDDRKTPGMELVTYYFDSKDRYSFDKTPYGYYPAGISEDHQTIFCQEGYGPGDQVLYMKKRGSDEAVILHGVPLSDRGQEPIPPNGIGRVYLVDNDTAVIFSSVIDSDRGAFHRIELSQPGLAKELKTMGLTLPKTGELVGLTHIIGDQYYISYNADGVSHYYETYYRVGDEGPYLEISKEIIGNNTKLNQGVNLSLHYDKFKAKQQGRATEFVVSFTKATMPSQLYLVDITTDSYTQLSNEQVLGISQEYLSEGEDTSFESYDGLRVSARLYMPSEKLGYEGARPLVVYIHGGPQSQEKPDFTWFSMPLIQYLTLNGFAVFVPNVRGSTGYGFAYMNYVTRDWGGRDLKDHLEALKKLENDPRIDSTKRAVMGRSYGGYMTLSLVSRHPELWQASCDMFGPYDLIGFYHRLPPSWQSIFDLTLGHPERDKDFLIERSPKTYFDQIQAPMLIIQGANDPRVTLEESREIFEELKAKGKDVDLLVFEDEGHDVIKFENKVKCYTDITTYFKKHLGV